MPSIIFHPHPGRPLSHVPGTRRLRRGQRRPRLLRRLRRHPHRRRATRATALSSAAAAATNPHAAIDAYAPPADRPGHRRTHLRPRRRIQAPHPRLPAALARPGEGRHQMASARSSTPSGTSAPAARASRSGSCSARCPRRKSSTSSTSPTSRDALTREQALDILRAGEDGRQPGSPQLEVTATPRTPPRRDGWATATRNWSGSARRPPPRLLA